MLHKTAFSTPGALSPLARIGRKCVVGLSLGAIAALVLPGAANADVTYTYTGACFTTTSNSTPPVDGYSWCQGSHTDGDRISGWFSLQNAIAPDTSNLDLTAAPDLEFAFSDGRTDHTGPDEITNADVPLLSKFLFLVSTDSQGNISDWLIDLVRADPGFFQPWDGMQRWSIMSSSTTGDTAQIDQQTALGGSTNFQIRTDSASAGPAGQWTTQGTNSQVTVSLRTVPEPTTLALLGLGIAGLGIARRLR